MKSHTQELVDSCNLVIDTLTASLSAVRLHLTTSSALLQLQENRIAALEEEVGRVQLSADGDEGFEEGEDTQRSLWNPQTGELDTFYKY
jgi:hypothetical protein